MLLEVGSINILMRKLKYRAVKGLLHGYITEERRLNDEAFVLVFKGSSLDLNCMLYISLEFRSTLAWVPRCSKEKQQYLWSGCLPTWNLFTYSWVMAPKLFVCCVCVCVCVYNSPPCHVIKLVLLLLGEFSPDFQSNPGMFLCCWIRW